MWLLSTARAELHEFIGPEAVPGGFAILSHVWEEEEQSFKDLRALCERCKLTGENPRDRAHPKIRRFCECAESWGHDWVWADMCCIDKSSSSELSEAINSMCRYYSLAEVCYAYLCDVHPYSPVEFRVADADWLTGAGLSRWEESFKSSRWHTRGWTLQELLAPRMVIFLSKDWDSLGAKADLAPLLNQCTGIPEDVLTLSKHPTHFSIAQRMSWAAQRKTTRPEDEAYCLMGLFDVNMPTLYGEGRRAFRRLQEEIMRRSVDPSLFAWGLECDPKDISQRSASTCPWDQVPAAHLFARSPSDFALFQFRPRDESQHSNDEKVRPLNTTLSLVWCLTHYQSQWTQLGLQGSDEFRKVPTFGPSLTPFGVLANLLTLRISGQLYAMLLGRKIDFDPVVLELERCLSVEDAPEEVYHPVRRRRLRAVLDERPTHVGLGGGTAVGISWRSIYLSTEPPYSDWQHNPRAQMSPQAGLASPFDIPAGSKLGLFAGYVTSSEVSHPWKGDPPLRLFFRDVGPSGPYVRFVVHLGCCTTVQLGSERTSMIHWARATSGNEADLPDDRLGHGPFTTHDCPGDHIDTWNDRTRIYPRLSRHNSGAWDASFQDVELSFIESSLPVPSGWVKPLKLGVKVEERIYPPRLLAALLQEDGDEPHNSDAEPAAQCPSVYPTVTTASIDNYDCQSKHHRRSHSAQSGPSRRRHRSHSDDDEHESSTTPPPHPLMGCIDVPHGTSPAAFSTPATKSIVVPVASNDSGLIYPEQSLLSTPVPSRPRRKRARRQ